MNLNYLKPIAEIIKSPFLDDVVKLDKHRSTQNLKSVTNFVLEIVIIFVGTAIEHYYKW